MLPASRADDQDVDLDKEMNVMREEVEEVADFDSHRFLLSLFCLVPSPFNYIFTFSADARTTTLTRRAAIGARRAERAVQAGAVERTPPVAPAPGCAWQRPSIFLQCV